MAIARILLILPAANTKTFGSNEGDGARREKTIAPPLGILYLAAELIAAGYDVEACDFNAEDYSDRRLLTYASRADLVGISLMSFNRTHARHIIDRLNAACPGLPIIVGGPDCMLHPRAIPCTTLTVCHEAEDTIVPIARTVLERGDFSRLPGVVYRDDDGSVRTGRAYSCRNDLDGLRFPARELLRDNKGYTVIGKRASRGVTTIITSRGCPKRCRFCAHNAIAYRRYRERSAENVLAELEDIAERDYRIVGIVDDNFTAHPRRARAILEGIIERKFEFTIGVQGRADAADDELFALMRRAGVRLITFGLESGNQDVLDYYRKATTVAQNRRAIVAADRAGLYTAGLFILGAPLERREHFERTYRFAASLPLDVTSFWVLDYTYGSSLWDEARTAGRVTDDEHNVPAGRERGTSSYTTAELERIAQRLFFRYYTRPGYWLRQAIKMLRVRSVYFVQVLAVGLAWLLVTRARLAAVRVRRLWCRPGPQVAPAKLTATRPSRAPSGSSDECGGVAA